MKTLCYTITIKEPEGRKEGPTMNSIILKAMDELAHKKERSAWSRGVSVYAQVLLSNLDETISGGWEKPEILNDSKEIERVFLNGAKDWEEFSWGGSALISDYEIAETLCNPTELKRTNGGERRPNRNEEWLDVQARALYQASVRARRAIKAVL